CDVDVAGVGGRAASLGRRPAGPSLIRRPIMALDTTPTLVGDPWQRYGTDPVRPTGGKAMLPHVQSSATSHPPVWSPDNPLFWFGGLLLATGFGLFAISGSVKVAKTRVSGSVGEA